MSRVFLWIALVIATAMLALQIVVAKVIRAPITGLWILIALVCIYMLFFRRRT